MFRTSIVFFLATAALAQTNRVAPGYEFSSGAGMLKSGVRIRYKSVATPDESSLNLVATGITMSDDILHRFLIDKTTSTYFGYDLMVGPADATNRYQATFQPLTGTEEMVMGISGNPSLKPMMLPKYPPPQMVREGDLISLDLMVSADGTRKITDYVEILAPPAAPAFDLNAEARDFTLDDGSVKYGNTEHSFWVNGQARELTAFTGKPGATFWIAMPGQGRYIVSLSPREGFPRTGILHGDTISFQDGGQRYDVRFENSIAGRGKVWNLYVLHDTSYQPNAAFKDAVSAGTDRLDNLVR